MERDNLEGLVKDTFDTLKAMYLTYTSFSKIEDVVLETGKEEKEVAEVIIKRYLYSWDEKLAQTLIAISGGNKTASHHSVLFELSSGFIKEAADLIISGKEYNKYTLMLGCSYSISYLITCVDSITGIFYRAKVLNEQNSMSQDIKKKALEISTLSKDVENALRGNRITDEVLAKHFARYKQFIKSEVSAFDNTVVYDEFKKMFTDTVVELVAKNHNLITPFEIAEFVENSQNIDEDEIVRRIESIIDTRTGDISMVDDLNSDFSAVIGRESSVFKKDGGVALPIELICEVIVVGEVTDNYKLYMQANNEFGKTSEF